MKKPVIIPCVDETKDIKKVRISWTYLHGELEGEAGYDIFGFKDSFYGFTESIDSKDSLGIEQAIIECEYNGKDCLLYLWRNDFHNQTGLAVYKDDKKANEYANRKMIEKSNHI